MRRVFLRGCFVGWMGLLSIAAFGAERFEDIVVSPQNLLQGGDTEHGYGEYRILLENESATEGHTVRLVFPDQAYSFGNSIQSISRTVSLGPGAKMKVSLWQPGLPCNGNTQFRVYVDGEHLGTMPIPPGRHAVRGGYYYGSAGTPEVYNLFLSRSLNFDEMNAAILSTTQVAGNPDRAVGPPDAGGARTPGSKNAWYPDPSTPPHWLELDYDPPLRVTHVTVHETVTSPGEIILLSASRFELGRASLGGYAPRSVKSFTFPVTTQAVKIVRMEFKSPSAGIDAVHLSGPDGARWATAARASSSAPVGMYSRTHPGTPGTEHTLLRSELPVSEWSDQWLGYSRFDGVVLAAADLKSMGSGPQAALWRYAEAGGNVFILGAAEPPLPWSAFHKSSGHSWTSYSIGFGSCVVFQAQTAADLKGDAVEVLKEMAKRPARFWRTHPTDDAANTAFPVVENLQIPVRGIIFIMLGFVLVIGPVNLFILARMKRRIWMLWTIPALSVATCGMVFAYTVLSEGVTPRIRIEGVTLLDQVNHRATTFGISAYYCPLTPSQGLNFSYDTEVTPLVEIGNRRTGSARDLDWSHSQHLRRGWVTARIPAHFLLRKSETRRERLQVEMSGGSVEVVNGLGGELKSVWLADSKGKVYTAQRIRPGARAKLNPAPEFQALAPTIGPSALLYGIPFGTLSARMKVNPMEQLAPGTYLAELETNPFLETGLGLPIEATHSRVGSFVLGILETPLAP